ncbi:14604_t:CDS:2, partial [Funneliformis mosseae]
MIVYKENAYVKALLNQIFHLDVEEVQAEDYISIILVRPNSFLTLLKPNK